MIDGMIYPAIRVNIPLGPHVVLVLSTDALISNISRMIGVTTWVSDFPTNIVQFWDLTLELSGCMYMWHGYSRILQLINQVYTYHCNTGITDQIRHRFKGLHPGSICGIFFHLNKSFNYR